MSSKYSLSQTDLEKWALNFVRFCVIPTAVSFLATFSINFDWRISVGVAFGTFYTSVVDLGRKFIAGEPVTPVVPVQ